jgi:hypothetical protein
MKSVEGCLFDASLVFDSGDWLSTYIYFKLVGKNTLTMSLARVLRR